MAFDSKRKWKVFCNDSLWFNQNVLSPLEDVAEIDYFDSTYETLSKHLPKYDAYFASASVKLDSVIMDKARRLKVIATPSTGTDHIDREYADKKRIDILDLATEYELLDNFTATAEMAWCLLLSLIRHLPEAFNSAKKGEWKRQEFSGFQLKGKTIGILGMGRLGKMMAKMALGFDMKVLACDIEPFEFPGVRRVDFDTLLSSSDVLSLHIHLTAKNKGIFSRQAFSKMKHGVIVLNTARGGLIDEDALLENLISGRVAGAGLDVIDGEWRNDLSQHPLIQFANQNTNLIITPHIGGSSTESIVGAREFMATKLLNYIHRRNNEYCNHSREGTVEQTS